MQLGIVTEKDANFLVSRYGSRRGFIRTYWYRMLGYLGAYRQYKNVDWQSIERLVFVCKGNICRSAYAEAVARSMGVEAISCGIDTIENAPANKSAIRAAIRKGLSLDDHKTQPIMYLTLNKSDLLITMEPWQAVYLKSNLTRKYNYTLLGLWGKPELPHLQDPYGSDIAYFDRCFTNIHNAVQCMAKNLT